MARTNGNKQLAIILFLFGGYLFYQQSQKKQLAPQYVTAPPAPPRSNPQQYMQWIKVITDLYGKTSDLWKPGGPFYKEPVPKYDAGSQFWQDVSDLA